ncbi:hypothetical protein T484DRAFT_1845961 [Baffinella frigidus]|nr:hypothetical protein T484DRAFT_1845961 [Cryptophyta sp. CCMP2293]
MAPRGEERLQGQQSEGRRKKGGRGERKAGLGFLYRRLTSGLFYVTQVKEGGPAAREGQMRQGDTLTHVADTPLKGVSTKELAGMLLGEQGSEVALTVQRSGGKEHVLLLTRGGREPPAQAQAQARGAGGEGEREGEGEGAAPEQPGSAGSRASVGSAGGKDRCL